MCENELSHIIISIVIHFYCILSILIMDPYGPMMGAAGKKSLVTV